MTHANPGLHHLTVGDVTVTAMNDGQFDASLDYVVNLPRADGEALLRDGFRVSPPRITVSCFLLQTGGKRVLVDTGASGAMGPVLGQMPKRLAALGVGPETIAHVLITHAHVDHVSGLLDGDGAAAFPNAELVINAAETGFWLNKDIEAQMPEEAKAYFGIAQRALAPYAERMRLVQDGQEALPGITAKLLPGHTPGHTGWLLASGDAALLIWGDVVHLPGLQFARPEAGMAFDTDKDQARATRERAFDMAATDRLLVAGMHLDFPTFGHVRRAGAGYAFEPVVWAPAEGGLLA